MSEAETKNKSLMVLSEVNEGVRQTSVTVDYSTVNYSKLETIYKTEQLIFQAVNIISTFAVSKGYDYVVSDNSEEEIDMKEIILSFDNKVGLPKMITDIVRHLHIYGNAYLEIIYSKTDNKKVVGLALIDPKTITFKKKGTGEIDLDESGNIKGYVQTVNAKKIDLEPEQVIHFRINTIADSLTGTGIIEPLVKIIEAKRNIEAGLSEAIYRHGFPQFHVKLGDTEHQPTGEQVTEESEKYKRINSKSEFVTPYYYDIKVLESPSIKGGESYLKYFIDQIVAGTGVPQTILLGTGENSNRASSFTQQQNFFLYISAVQTLISEILSKDLFTKILTVDECPVYMNFNSLETKSDLELAQEREIYLRNGVLTPDEVRQEMGLEPISQSPYLPQPITDDSGAFIFSTNLDDPELRIEAEEDFVFNANENMEFGGILQNLSEPIKSRFIQDQQILSHKIDKIMDKYRNKIDKEIDLNLTSDDQELAGENIFIDSELLAPERDALIAAIFLDSKKKFKQGIALGEDFIKKQYPQVAGIKVKSTVNEGAIKALDLRATQLAKTVHGDLLTATQIAIREGLQARKGARQLKEDIEKVFEKYGGTSGRFQKLGTRAELIARTELHRSFIDGTLQSFKELKVSKVAMVVNTGACEECIELSADHQEIPLHLSQGIIPIHPRCRCGWVASQVD
jgi:HK97 family phage portal protein